MIHTTNEFITTYGAFYSLLMDRGIVSYCNMIVYLQLTEIHKITIIKLSNRAFKFDRISANVNEGGQCDVLTLDFSKAFDKVPHARLYQKLSLYGIRGPILTWLQAFLTRSQRVIVVNMKNLATHVLSGVPQGTVLAPPFNSVYQ